MKPEKWFCWKEYDIQAIFPRGGFGLSDDIHDECTGAINHGSSLQGAGADHSGADTGFRRGGSHPGARAGFADPGI